MLSKIQEDMVHMEQTMFHVWCAWKLGIIKGGTSRTFACGKCCTGFDRACCTLCAVEKRQRDGMHLLHLRANDERVFLWSATFNVMGVGAPRLSWDRDIHI